MKLRQGQLPSKSASAEFAGAQLCSPKPLLASNYLKGWFAVDFISCIPVGHITFIMEQYALEELGSLAGDDENANNFKALKGLRLFRLSKMLRLARLKRIMQKYENLMVVQQYIGIFAMLAAIVFTAHFLSCLWCECCTWCVSTWVV